MSHLKPDDNTLKQWEAMCWCSVTYSKQRRNVVLIVLLYRKWIWTQSSSFQGFQPLINSTFTLYFEYLSIFFSKHKYFNSSNNLNELLVLLLVLYLTSNICTFNKVIKYSTLPTTVHKFYLAQDKRNKWKKDYYLCQACQTEGITSLVGSKLKKISGKVSHRCQFFGMVECRHTWVRAHSGVKTGPTLHSQDTVEHDNITQPMYT